ncbi:MAG: transposase [Chitinispirillaceae bacterium]|nr:transposase [Chitinispirillaceae bacterium]
MVESYRTDKGVRQRIVGYIGDITKKQAKSLEHAESTLCQRGYSRDSRPDCKQVCIGLVVTREGLPLGYEIFAGNRHDSTTVEEIVETMEKSYGAADRIWVMDRGMVSEKNLAMLDRQRTAIYHRNPKV